ncbi:MAG: response regulator, partial [Planctomycetes bacterium]|nr:response regulator [Planctomycetota bacterium]
MSDKDAPWLLLVEDDENSTAATIRVLQDMNIHVQCVHSGEDALKSLMNRDYFLILLDVKMRGMDGFETAAYIRESENYKHIPFIFMTGVHIADLFVDKGYDQGAVDYLIKPINPHWLLSKVKCFLDMYEMRLQMERNIAEMHIYDHMVAHDLKAPIRGIEYCISVIKEEMLDAFEGVSLECLQLAEARTEQAKQLISSIL